MLSIMLFIGQFNTGTWYVIPIVIQWGDSILTVAPIINPNHLRLNYIHAALELKNVIM